MKTYIYIDGFNFYYLALKYSNFKWLDFKVLFQKLLSPQNDIVKIKYFTAHVSGKYNKEKPRKQNTYLNALQRHIPELEIIKGHFQTNEVYMPLAKQPYSKVKVLKTEEKCSDVNLAVHMVNDAWKGLYDCAVVLSNDGELLEAFRIVHNELKLSIGLFTPDKVRTSKSLLRYTTFRKRIRKNVLKNSLLPNPIPNTDICKPSNW
jgi:uncharacterized LabA/DUF88 family protein